MKTAANIQKVVRLCPKVFFWEEKNIRYYCILPEGHLTGHDMRRKE